jgi:dihydrodipicolinate synthase/N-acetylneuraminate lyase
VRSVEDTRPRRGLSVPVVSVLDRAGELREEDQRRLVRFVIQGGDGADVIFAAGTTGEWDKLPAALQRRVVRVCAEEAAKANAGLGEHERVEVWAGVTAHEPRVTLENLEAAVAAGADAAVIAPLSIRGLADPVAFVAREVADLLDGAKRRIPVYLYDNADIAADPKLPHIRTRQVKALSRLDFVRGIKVSAPLDVLGNYTRAAAGFRERGEFGIYVGNAHLIFEIFRPRKGLLGVVAEHWQRRRMRGGLPVGVVAGPANPLPREWARAWQVCRSGDGERMAKVERVLAAYRDATHGPGGRRSVACLKRALFRLGVIGDDAVAAGTKALTAEQAAAFDAAFDGVQRLARELLPASWLSAPLEAAR